MGPTWITLGKTVVNKLKHVCLSRKFHCKITEFACPLCNQHAACFSEWQRVGWCGFGLLTRRNLIESNPIPKKSGSGQFLFNSSHLERKIKKEKQKKNKNKNIIDKLLWPKELQRNIKRLRSEKDRWTPTTNVDGTNGGARIIFKRGPRTLNQ